MNKTKSKHGTVVIRSDRGRLRLVWTYQGRRYCLCLGLVDSPMTRAIANMKASQIYQDIATQRFDNSLSRYKESSEGVTTAELFERFKVFKCPELQPTTLVKYRSVSLYIEHFQWEQKPADLITAQEAIAFKNWLVTQIKPVTARDRITLLKASWDFGLSKGWVKSNPWGDALKNLKSVPRKPPTPFTAEELESILRVAYERYPAYGPFIEFLAGTGARPGEVIGLTWANVREECDRIWLGEQLTRRGERRPAKCGKSETLHLSPRLEILLRKLRPEAPKPDDLVFSGSGGGRIYDNNFRRRVWSKILAELGLEYRKPYFLRSTAITHFLGQGLSPAEVAQITRNTPRTIYQSYAGSLREARVPDYREVPHATN